MAAHFRALHDQTEVLAEADLHFHTGRQIELHQRVNGFIRWLDDVQNTLMSANLVLVTRVFVDVRETRTVKRSLRVGSGIGPRTCAPVRFAVSTISWVDWSIRRWSKAFNLIRIC